MVICNDIEGKKYKVGSNQLSFRPSVYGVIIKNGKILLSKQWGGYNLPGGGMDLGETIEGALKREVFEETGIKIRVGKVIDCKNSFFKLPFSGKYVHSILMFYTCEALNNRIDTKKLSNDEKQYSDFPEWMDLKNLKKLKFRCSIDSSNIIKKALAKKI